MFSHEEISYHIIYFGFALVVICGIGLYAQGEKLEKEDSYNDKVTTNLSKNIKRYSLD